VTPNVLTSNYTGGDWSAHVSLLRGAAELAVAGKLRVARPGVDLAIGGIYNFSIYDFDAEYAAQIGSRRALSYEGPAGPELYPTDIEANAGSGMIRNCEDGFDHAWLASGVDMVHGQEAHLGRAPAELEPADAGEVAQRTAAYIGEMAAAGGWR
jgi:hypothetical protein